MLCAAAICCLPEDTPMWAGRAGQETTPLKIALEHGHAAAAEVILKAAVKSGNDMSGSAAEAVEMLHKAASK